jgi:type IV secretory pathway ATPase VirB11/archaellum biosynthesis ATPase
MRVNCANCVFGSSLEDFDVCFAKTLDKILQFRKVERIVLAGTREYEYDYEQTKLLIEIAEVYDKLVNREKILSFARLGSEKCERCFPKRLAELQFLLTEMLRKDPIGAYVKINRMIRASTETAGQQKIMCKKCYDFYIKNALIPIKEELEKTSLIKMIKDKIYGYKLGDRSIYREIFTPLIRPIFMLTRYSPIPPIGGRPLMRYKISGNIIVEIFDVPGKVRRFYHVSPPEFRLSDEKYSIIDSARKYLAEHRPTETETTQPERTREILTNMGKELVRSTSIGMGLQLTENELNEMVDILVRYTVGFGVLEVLLADDKVQDIYINSPIGITPIYLAHDDFEECETNLIPTREDAEGWATRFRLMSGRPLDEANPVLDTELFSPGGRARVCAITRTLSPEGIGYAIRRHRERPWTYPLFIEAKFCDSIFAGLMSFFVDGSRSLLFSGGRSSGKTSLLSATLLEIMKRFRIVTVEDTLELPVFQLRDLGYNIERLKSRSVITRVEAELPADEALRTAIRLGDSCLIVGEVRSTEAKALYEAMRIGALTNVVAGTIHGESAYGVFDRVVNDLGVAQTSFKATDIIIICGRLRTADGMHTFRRVVEVTEVRKHWKDDPVEEGGFVNLMEYNAKEDKLMPTETLINGESFIINEISKRVKEWHGNWDAVWSNIELRGRVKQAIVDYARKTGNREILEAGYVSSSNDMFHVISNKVKDDFGYLDSKEIFKRWDEWFKKTVK